VYSYKCAIRNPKYLDRILGVKREKEMLKLFLLCSISKTERCFAMAFSTATETQLSAFFR